MLNSLLGRKADTGSQPAIQPAQATTTQRREEMFEKQAAPKPEPVRHRAKTGLRPKGLPQHQLDQLAKGCQTFEFPLEAFWHTPEVGQVEVLCWEHYDGTLEALESFAGRRDQLGWQRQQVLLDSRGYYKLLQIHHDPASGTRCQLLTVPRDGVRKHMHRPVTNWTTAFNDILPKGMNEMEALTTGLGLLLEFPNREVTEYQHHVNRIKAAQAHEQALKRAAKNEEFQATMSRTKQHRYQVQ